MSTELNQTRVYRISIWRYLVLWWALGPFLLLGLGLAIFAGDESRGAGIAIALLMVPFFLLWHFLVRKSRLEISSRGVRAHDFGGGLEAAWDEIVGVRTDRGHEGFITARPMETKGARRLAANAGLMQMHDEGDLQLIGAQRFIPIKAFAFHLRQGDLRQVIAQHAPHLKNALDALDAPPVPKPPATPAQRRRNWLVAGIIVAAIAGTLILIARGERSQAWFFTVAYGVLDPLFALYSGYYAWRQLKRKNWLLGVPMLLFALVMVGWTVQHWMELQHRLHDAQ